MSGPRTEQALARLADLTPRRIVAELDRYIVGQAEAKKAVAIALRNRWRRQRAPEGIRQEISPNNIILIGPTGVGKTEIARRLAKLSGAPFVKVEASKFTEVGYVGRDVEGMVRDLVDSAIEMVRTERELEVEDLANDRVDERLLDLLLPPPPPPAAQATGTDRVFVAGPEGNVQQEQALAEERHKRTREKLKQLLRDGQLEQREVEVEVAQQPPMMDQLSQPGA
ncbi:MAG TPA: AAA family ATPase, partial [Gemmatimonadaceae bacterium]|nr:AAA family ATPase [Gemmatimonadaceae bacterium]